MKTTAVCIKKASSIEAFLLGCDPLALSPERQLGLA
jgi:hypothetical protein